MKKNNFMCKYDEITIIDLSIIDNFINLYSIYLDKKAIYNSYVDEVNSHFLVNKNNDIINEIYLKILQINTENINRILQNDVEGREATASEVKELKRLSSNIQKYQTILELFKITDEDTLSKFLKTKSFSEIEADVRSENEDLGEIYIMTKTNSIYFSQDEILTKKISDLYSEILSVKKYMDILNLYEERLRTSNFLTYRLIKQRLNKCLKAELQNEKNENFLSILSKNGDISALVIEEIKKYSKYVSVLSDFNNDMYSTVMNSLDVIENEIEETQLSEGISLLRNNKKADLNVQRLYDLYEAYGVDKYYLGAGSVCFEISYEEALVKLNFCEDYYRIKHNCSAAGSFFQVEVLLMNNIEFHAKFGIDISDLFSKYGEIEENISDIKKNDICYKKAI